MTGTLKDTLTQAPAFPITRTLKDKTGRPLEATIIGRDAKAITVIRRNDGAQFDIPYARLSTEDHAFVITLPLQAASLSVRVDPPGALSAGTPERGTIGFRRARLKEVDDLLRKNQNFLYQTDPKTMKGRTLKSENEKLLRERIELAEEIFDLESK